MMKIDVALFVAVVMATTVAVAYGASHTIGGSSGWNQGVDYTTWASGQTFVVGDTLVFNYGGSHSVNQVSQSDYDNCNTGNALKSYNGGRTTITLTSTSPMYFLCPTIGHCQGGMKLGITVGESSTTPGTSPSTPTTSTSPLPPPKSSSIPVSGYSNIMLIGVSFLVATVIGLTC